MQARPLPIGSTVWAATANRRHAFRQHEVQDRQIVRGQIPEHVDVRLYEPEVDPDRVHVLDLADLAVTDELTDPLYRWRVAVGVIAHQH